MLLLEVIMQIFQQLGSGLTELIFRRLLDRYNPLLLEISDVLFQHFLRNVIRRFVGDVLNVGNAGAFLFFALFR